jgi:hypothetical protein
MAIADNVTQVLSFLGKGKRGVNYDGQSVATGTGLSPDEINDAVAMLVAHGLAEWEQYYMTAPYDFGVVSLTARGRFEHEKAQLQPAPKPKPSRVVQAPEGRRPLPVGSPFGFTKQDWEVVNYRNSQTDTLLVVFGHKFKSKHYSAPDLQENVRGMFERALRYYNSSPNAFRSKLKFIPLGAGYGEHLFNQIAKDIISADIGVFDTSDLNPNVMLEFGVALTWGVPVLPIRKRGCPPPPSDLSGQTWAIYLNSGSEWPDPEHRNNLGRMVEKAIRRKRAPR